MNKKLRVLNRYSVKSCHEYHWCGDEELNAAGDYVRWSDIEAILDAEGDGGAAPELWIEFTDDGHNIRLWTRSEEQATEEIREGRKLVGFYARPPAQYLNEQSGISGQLEFKKGVLEGLSMAKSECDKRVFALDGGNNQFRREATASQCAEAIRLVYMRIFREIYPLHVMDTGPWSALQTLESWGMSGGELSGDDVPRFRALIDRIAPATHPQPARSGVVSDDARDAARLDEIARRAEKVVGSRGIRFELRFEPLSGRGRDLIDYIDAAIKSQGESNV